MEQDPEDDRPHYELPLRTWPTLYDGTASPHGVPEWWKPLNQVDVLICGAGPSGLEVALSLLRQGLTFRIIDKAPTPLIAGRADGVQPRFLETLSSWGLASEVQEEGPLIERTAIYFNGQLLHHGRSHQSDSRYRGLHIITQGQIERIYIRDLLRHKMLVERNTTLKEFHVDQSQSSDLSPESYPIHGIIENGITGQQETIRAKFLVGSDGGASSIRKRLGIPFDGMSTDLYWGIMDCVFETDYPHAWIFGSVVSSEHGGCVIIPRENGLIRLYTQLDTSQHGPLAASRQAIDPEVAESGGQIDVESITPDEVLEQANRIFAPYKLKFGAPLSWFAVWKISERVARSFSSDDLRVHLVGDSAVMGAFGLNASILDAANLAWKIGLCVSQDAAMEKLLPTYDRERRLHANRVIQVSGKYLRFVCSSPLPTANLYEIGAALGHETIEGLFSTEDKEAATTNGSGPSDHSGSIYEANSRYASSMSPAEAKAFLGDFFSRHGPFLLGVDAAYGWNCISPPTRDVVPQSRPPIAVKNGVRAPNPRLCFDAAHTGYLYDHLTGTNRFHLVLFVSDLLGPVREKICRFSSMLAADAPLNFYARYGGPRRFNIVVVAKGTPFEVEERLQGDDLCALGENATFLFDDRTPDEDAHSTYGVNHRTGAVVVIRPDLWVGMSGMPDDLDLLNDYFAGFLTTRVSE
ncbi:uncharacterized protein N7500_003241 [Penicillium coprophilum]|uniref:uncharacterized protein n=1 Tax=Penicillium coprophilum TaxID=36646 RepID=UPI002392C404|nr:uncharacterized protein N7500_003241 [Penicillium coprophilum]KAJ5170458.1 hypothetical protein N7500_003241 [Penicillium coprophilum]